MKVRFTLNAKNTNLQDVGKGQKLAVTTLSLSPVRDSPENNALFAGQASGSLQLNAVGPSDAAAFEVGADYLVEISPAPANPNASADAAA